MTEPADRLSAALADRYRLERELGAGGMATVYLAEDLKHDRKVALKVLKPELAAVIGAERFLAEIKTTANLQSPHILPLFDSGEVQGTVFYVMPFVEGESLRDRLDREKQLPIVDALRIATQVAQALEYAHRRGVIHRDIKPENILLHDDSALVADFGIALAASRAGDARMTETGMSLGTPHYMSPEQAMGERDLDARTDVYALGVTLYEMLGGEPPFTGPTAQAIVARVLSDAPRPLSELRPTVPPHVEAAVRTALHKLPADRHVSASAFADALARPAPAHMVAAAPAASRGAIGRWVPWLVAAAAVLVAGMALVRGDGAALSVPPSRLAMLAPNLGGSGGTSLLRQIALTPDGGAVLFTAVDDEGYNRVMRQALDAEAPSVVALSGVPAYSVGNLVVSPDGGTLLFSTDEGFLNRVSIDGGVPAPIQEGLGLSNFSAFAPDGTIWTSTAGGWDRLQRLGAADTVIGELRGFTGGVRMQQVLADGKRALTVMRALGSASGPLALVDLEAGREIRTLLPDVVEARYAVGHLVAALNNGSLQAIPFDDRAGVITGAPVTIAGGVSLTGIGIAHFAVAGNGTVAYVPEEPRSLVFVDRAGVAREVLEDRRNFHAPLFSPDGRRLAMDFNSADGRDVWVLDLEGGTLTRATFDRDGHDATWSPDGRTLTYTSGKSGVIGVYRARPGSVPAESLLASPILGWTGEWLRDGSRVLTVGNAMGENTQSDIGIVENGGRGPIQPLIASPFNEQFPALSPNERWLAYASDQSGQMEVYVRPLEGDGDLVQVSQNGGNEPAWRDDGAELFYRGFTAGGQPVMMAVRVQGGDTFAVTAREELFSLTDYVGTAPHANYDISPDGRHFAMVRRSPSTRIMIIQNLPALVERLQGAGAGGT
jgi:Tol biopolymer transport system component